MRSPGFALGIALVSAIPVRGASAQPIPASSPALRCGYGPSLAFGSLRAPLAETATITGATADEAVPPDDGFGPVLDEITVIAAVGERLTGPARPDTKLAITGRELREKGVTNLAQALDLVTETLVRDRGRGGYQVDIRGARKGGVLVILDGVPISDPFNGNFDLTSIPSTDIAEIRIATTPASPLDGPGGNGGVIEVLTRAARGRRDLRAHVQASDGPSGAASLTGRSELPLEVFARASATGTLLIRDFPAVLPGGALTNVDEDARSGSAGLRLERRFGTTNVATDASFTRRRFFVPPGESTGAEVLLVEREDLVRAILGVDSSIGDWFVSARGYGLFLAQKATRFEDASLREPFGQERQASHRAGASVQADFHVSDPLRLSFAGHVVREGTENVFVRDRELAGGVTLIEPALGAAWAATSYLALEGGAGVVVPAGVGASPWPEAKISLTLTSTPSWELGLTGARKGRVPTLRDRFDLGVGTPRVGPEQSSSVEGHVAYQPLPWLSARVTGFYRFTQGLIVLNDARTEISNLGDIGTTGFEVQLKVVPARWASTGALYAYAVATSERLGRDPLDFFPPHRAEGWISLHASDLGLWGRVRYLGDRIDNDRTLEGYVSVDATLSAYFDPARISLRAENLLDAEYESRARVPGFGRTIFLGLESTFE